MAAFHRRPTAKNAKILVQNEYAQKTETHDFIILTIAAKLDFIRMNDGGMDKLFKRGRVGLREGRKGGGGEAST